MMTVNVWGREKDRPVDEAATKAYLKAVLEENRKGWKRFICGLPPVKLK